MKVVWSAEAVSRLAEIHDFIAADSPESTARLVDRLIRRAEGLRRFPRSGRRVAEFPGADLREVVEGSYRVVYRLRRSRVEVITVFEGHRLLREDELR